MWCVLPMTQKNQWRSDVTCNANKWLTIRTFELAEDCVESLLSEGFDLWVSDIAPNAEYLDATFSAELPQKTALVMGSEARGPHELFLKSASRVVCLPQFGWCDSFNVGVACAQCLLFMFQKYPELRGSISNEEKRALREKWYELLAPKDSQVPFEYFRGAYYRMSVIGSCSIWKILLTRWKIFEERRSKI